MICAINIRVYELAVTAAAAAAIATTAAWQPYKMGFCVFYPEFLAFGGQFTLISGVYAYIRECVRGFMCTYMCVCVC